ncbi:acetyl-CoA carboxylase biotin carboxylase subunit [Nakamurella sp. GG22]
MFDSLLVANRGEIAGRVIRTANRMGLRTIAVYSEADASLPFVAEADEAVLIGPAAVAESYNNAYAILKAAKASGAQAIHPGYGFLSENSEFAEAVEGAGMVWVGPSARAIVAMGNKVAARNLVSAAGVPVAPGTEAPVTTAEAAAEAAGQIGFPVMIKASAGGGGMGMAVVDRMEDLAAEYEKVTNFAGRLFGDPAVFLERYFPRVRHVEVQILGLPDGRVLSLGDRECSVQRRNQKVVEETPSPALDDELRDRMTAAARKAGEAVQYRGAGTVEFLLSPAEPAGEGGTGKPAEFFFLEMNTRLQVEHPITEAVFGIDLVEAQLRVAAGEDPGLGDLTRRGHAIELRVNAEDPKRFLPSAGAITGWHAPSGPGVRVDAGYGPDTTVTPHYDSLMAKVIVHGADRQEALRLAAAAVRDFSITGPKSNLPFLAEVLEYAEFVSGDYDTGIVGRMRSS